jgi:hypothetical protein
VSQVPVVRTVVSMRGFAAAVVRAWPAVSDAPPTREAVGVLWAQHCIETGGAACWHWNIGNVKAPAGDGDYYCLRGTWEGVSPTEAARLIAVGEAVADPSPNHAKAVGDGKVSVVFVPPHPATRFRAFPSLDEAMHEHLMLLAKRRYASAWPSVLAGDVRAFAHALKAGPDRKEGTWDDYYTASAKAYDEGMQPAFRLFVESDAFDEAMRAVSPAADTVPALPVEPLVIVHPVVETVEAAQRRDE